MKFVGDPFFNQLELRKKYLKALKEQDISTLLVEQPPEPPQDPQMVKIEADIQAQKVEVTAMAEKMMAEMDKIAAQTADLQAATMLKLAQAEAIQIGPQMDIYMAQFQAMLDRHNAAKEQGNDDTGRVPGMEAPPVDGEIPQVPAGLPAGLDEQMGGGPLEGAGIVDGNSQMPDGAGNVGA